MDAICTQLLFIFQLQAMSFMSDKVQIECSKLDSSKLHSEYQQVRTSYNTMHPYRLYISYLATLLHNTWIVELFFKRNLRFLLFFTYNTGQSKIGLFHLCMHLSYSFYTLPNLKTWMGYNGVKN